MSDHRRLIQALYREHLTCFVEKCFHTLEPGTDFRDNWHLRAIAHKLEQVSRGELRRLIINVPPRSLKSICVTVAWTAWQLGHDPTRKIIAVSYAQELARKHALDFRTVVDSPWYRELFPALQTQRRRQRDVELVTSQSGYRFAGGIGGSILGRGADIIVVDDPIKALDALSEAERLRVKQFYDNTLYTRLNDKRTGAIVIVMQRLHEDDLVGHVLERDQWDVLSLPATAEEEATYRLGDDEDDVHRRQPGDLLHPDREDAETLAAVRRALGSANFSAQYQQQPIPQEGAVIKRDWIGTYRNRPEMELVVVSWDTASTLEESSDYSVGTVWGLHGADFYLLDVVRGRYETPDLRRLIVDTHRRHEATTTLIEDSDIGRALAQDLRRTSRTCLPLLPRPRHDKLARLLAQAARFEAGQVLLPEEAPWKAAYLTELLAFPQGRNDDQVDSTSQALYWLTRQAAVREAQVRPDRPRPPGRSRQRRERVVP